MGSDYECGEEFRRRRSLRIRLQRQKYSNEELSQDRRYLGQVSIRVTSENKYDLPLPQSGRYFIFSWIIQRHCISFREYAALNEMNERLWIQGMEKEAVVEGSKTLQGIGM